MKKSFPEILFFLKFCFVSLPSDSLQFQKQLMTKSEMRLGFKQSGVVSPSLSYFHVRNNISKAIIQDLTVQPALLFLLHWQVIVSRC